MRRIELKFKGEIKFAFIVPILQIKNLKPNFDYRGIDKIFIIKENNKENQSFAEIKFSIKYKITGNFEGKICNKKENVVYI